MLFFFPPAYLPRYHNQRIHLFPVLLLTASNWYRHSHLDFAPISSISKRGCRPYTPSPPVSIHPRRETSCVSLRGPIRCLPALSHLHYGLFLLVPWLSDLFYQRRADILHRIRPPAPIDHCCSKLAGFPSWPKPIHPSAALNLHPLPTPYRHSSHRRSLSIIVPSLPVGATLPFAYVH